MPDTPQQAAEPIRSTEHADIYPDPAGRPGHEIYVPRNWPDWAALRARKETTE